MLLVYIAGPYVQGNTVKHARDAMLMAEEMWADGIVGLVPHLLLLQDVLSPRPADEWAKLNAEIASRCDVVLRMEGSSADADAVVRAAKARKTPVFYDYKSLLAFVREGVDGGV